MTQPRKSLKYRIWRFLSGKTLAQAARDVRLPVYVVSAIERGEIEPSERWARRFEEVYGKEAAAELLSPLDPAEALGPTIGRLPR